MMNSGKRLGQHDSVLDLMFQGESLPFITIKTIVYSSERRGKEALTSIDIR